MLKMKRLGVLTFVILGAICLVNCQSSLHQPTAADLEHVSIVKSTNDDRQYSATMLENELQVVLVSDPSLENAAVSLAVGVGSAQDPKNHMGLAHYLEHMLFLGTEKYPEPAGFMKYTQANGGMTNAFTAFDITNFMFQINASKLDEALDRFSDYFKKPTFDPQYSDKERHAVNNEWSLQKAQDGWNIFALQGMTANPASPASQFNIGNLDTLKDQPDSVLQDALTGFYRRYYSSNIMKLTLVGKQSLPELKALAIKHFSTIPNKNAVRPEVTVPGLTETEMGKAIYYKSLKDLKNLYVDFPVKSNHKNWRSQANSYIHQLLTTEESGTLCKELRDLELAKNVSAYIDDEAYGPDGFLRVQVDLTDEGLAKQDQIIAAIFSYVDLIKKQGINKSYYREFKAIAEKNFTSAPKPQPLNQAVELSMKQFDYPVANLLNSDYFYGSYNPKVIKQLTDQLDKQHARIWYVSQNENANSEIPFFEGHYAIRDLTKTDFQKWSEISKNYDFNLPPLNDLLSDEAAAIVEPNYKKPKEILSQKGVEAFLVHSQFYQQEGNASLNLQINSDLAQSSIQNRIMSHLINDIYNKQTMSLMDKASRVSLKISTNLTSANSQAIFIAGYSPKLSLLMDKMLDQFVSLKIDQVAFDQAMDSYQQGLENSQKDHVFRQTFAQINRLTNKIQTTKSEYLAASKTLRLEDLKTYHNALMKTALIRIFVMGNYSDERVKELALSAHKKFPTSRSPDSRAISQYQTPGAAKPILFKEDVDLADSAVLQGWFGHQKSDDEQAQLVVLNAIFGNAFFTQLRTNEQLGYVVTSGQYPVDDIPGFFILVQSSNTDLVGIKARMDKFRIEYLPALENLDEKEVISARDSLIANFLEKPVDFYQEANWYRDEFFNGEYAFDGRDRYLASLKKVTKSDLIAIYQSMLLSEQSGYIEIQLRGTNFKNKPFAANK